MKTKIYASLNPYTSAFFAVCPRRYLILPIEGKQWLNREGKFAIHFPVEIFEYDHSADDINIFKVEDRLQTLGKLFFLTFSSSVSTLRRWYFLVAAANISFKADSNPPLPTAGFLALYDPLLAHQGAHLWRLGYV